MDRGRVRPTTAPTEPPRVRFRNPLIQYAVLAYTWTYLDGRRSAILAWLRELVTHPDSRTFAYAPPCAAGIIAWQRPRSMRSIAYLRSWAGDISLALRQSAASAFSVMGADPELKEMTWRLIESWAEETDGKLRTTSFQPPPS